MLSQSGKSGCTRLASETAWFALLFHFFFLKLQSHPSSLYTISRFFPSNPLHNPFCPFTYLLFFFLTGQNIMTTNSCRVHHWLYIYKDSIKHHLFLYRSLFFPLFIEIHVACFVRVADVVSGSFFFFFLGETSLILHDSGLFKGVVKCLLMDLVWKWDSYHACSHAWILFVIYKYCFFLFVLMFFWFISEQAPPPLIKPSTLELFSRKQKWFNLCLFVKLFE